jgi:hypothetical protein
MLKRWTWLLNRDGSLESKLRGPEAFAAFGDIPPANGGIVASKIVYVIAVVVTDDRRGSFEDRHYYGYLATGIGSILRVSARFFAFLTFFLSLKRTPAENGCGVRRKKALWSGLGQ